MTEIYLYTGDITKLSVDAIVNAANRSLLGGGGVDGAIHRAAGPQLLEECKKLGGAKVGEAKITKGYNLPAKYVIHAVGPIWYGGFYNEKKKLANAYRNSLEVARQHNIKTIAFPNISTGIYRFPKKKAAQIAISTVLDYINQYPDQFEKIIFATFDPENFEIYKQYFEQNNIPYKLLNQ